MANLTASTLLPILRDRIAHLADTLAELRHRVREAVAVEMGRIVSETVRDLLTDLLRRDPADRESLAYHRLTPDPRHEAWADEISDLEPAPVAEDPAPDRTGSRFWPAVLSFGLTVARWLFRHKTGWWPISGFGSRVVESPLVRHPLTRSSFDAVATAAELVRLTAPTTTRP
jgi:hypothetical protein